jgi:hypothetical protein
MKSRYPEGPFSSFTLAAVAVIEYGMILVGDFDSRCSKAMLVDAPGEDDERDIMLPVLLTFFVPNVLLAISNRLECLC